MITRRAALLGLTALPLLRPALADPDAWRGKLISAARSQIGVTVSYDAAYRGLDYPMGDVSRSTGVCTDVVIRAYRDAFAFDLQSAVHEDMVESFSSYPGIWGLSRTDRNIDHRRVPNLETYLEHQDADRGELDWQPGDLMTCRVPPHLPHIAIVSDRVGDDGQWLVIHNIGRGTREESLLGQYREERRFHFPPPA